MLMFGHEVSTPLDLMYELPQLIKPVPNNQWVWELRDKIESAQNLVRQNTQQAMHRQKHIYTIHEYPITNLRLETKCLYISLLKGQVHHQS